MSVLMSAVIIEPSINLLVVQGELAILWVVDQVEVAVRPSCKETT